MKELDSTKIWTIGLLVLIGLFTVFYLWGVEAVPFHPDESTYLFMSSDLETLFQAPTSLIWQPEIEGDRRQQVLVRPYLFDLEYAHSVSTPCHQQ